MASWPMLACYFYYIILQNSNNTDTHTPLNGMGWGGGNMVMLSTLFALFFMRSPLHDFIMFLAFAASCRKCGPDCNCKLQDATGAGSTFVLVLVTFSLVSRPTILQQFPATW